MVFLLVTVPGRGENWDVGINLIGGGPRTHNPELDGLVAGPSAAVGGASNTVGANHPLLIRHADSPAVAAPANYGAAPVGGMLSGLRGVHRIIAPGARQTGLHRQGAVRQRGYRISMSNNNDQGILRR